VKLLSFAVTIGIFATMVFVAIRLNQDCEDGTGAA